MVLFYRKRTGYYHQLEKKRVKIEKSATLPLHVFYSKMAPTARRISAPTLAADASFGMANVTLSNDSLNFLQKHRHFNNSSTSQSRCVFFFRSKHRRRFPAFFRSVDFRRRNGRRPPRTRHRLKDLVETLLMVWGEGILDGRWRRWRRWRTGLASQPGVTET